MQLSIFLKNKWLLKNLKIMLIMILLRSKKVQFHLDISRFFYKVVTNRNNTLGSVNYK